MKRLGTIPGVLVLVAIVAACTDMPTGPDVPNGLTPTFAEAGAIGIGGIASKGGRLRIEASLTPAGTAGGFTLRDAFALGGHVIEVVAPSIARPHWCITAVRLLVSESASNRDGRIIVWILDVGDGISTFDKTASGVGRESTSCANEPDPPVPFSPVTSGDYKARP